MALQTLARQYTHRPRFTPDELVISKSQHETRYIPSMLLPNEIELTIDDKLVGIEFRYGVSETSEAVPKAMKPNVRIITGRETGQILHIYADFARGDFDQLLATFNDIILALKYLRGTVWRETVRRSYDKLIDFINQIALPQVKSDKIQILDVFTKSQMK